MKHLIADFIACASLFGALYGLLFIGYGVGF